MKKRLRGKLPFTICVIIALFAAAVFTVRLADWQLLHGKEYHRLATRSTSFNADSTPTRGEILDCNGVGLVTNITHYKIVFDKLYINGKKLDSTILNLEALLQKTGDKWDDVLPIALQNDTFVFTKNSDEDVASLREFLKADKDADAARCMQLLESRYALSGDSTAAQKRTLAAVHYNMELSDYSNATPYTFASDVSRDAVSVVSENTQGIGGVDVQTYLVRTAQNPTLAPHVLGALGAVSEEEYAAFGNGAKQYAITDDVGKFGVERAFEPELKGVGGTKIIQRNSDGTIVNTVETIDSQPGSTVYLTLDSQLQQVAVKSLETNIKAAQAEGKEECAYTGKKLQGEDCESGAVVMLDVSDFSVLAAASYPTYDLNQYSQYGDYYAKLAADKRSPMYNRAFSGTFEWGSVFKPCVALAALQEKIIKPDTEIFCTQEYDFYPSNVVECMHRHEEMDLRGAITQSCNYYFAETGRRLGIDAMSRYAEKFGLGEYTGLEVDESKGVLAGRDSTDWQPGNTVQAAIGQSDNAFTPVQLATYTATIANNGTRLKTHLVRKITDYERQTVTVDNSKPVTVGTCGISPENLKIVQEDMLNVTRAEEGTAYPVFGDYKVKVAAKTGTAENSGSDHTTFICYAPYEKPKVAVAVVLEHGVRGKYSMQVAKDLLDKFFSTPAKK